MVSAVHLGGEGPFLFLKAGPLTLVFRGPHPVFELTSQQIAAGVKPTAARPTGWGSLREPAGTQTAWVLGLEEAPPADVASYETPKLRVLRVPSRGLLALWIHENVERFVLLHHDGKNVPAPQWCTEAALHALLRTPASRA